MLLDHGEPDALAAMATRLADEGYRPVTALFDRTYVLTRTSAEPLPSTGARLAPGQATRPDWHNDRSAFLVALNERLQALPDDAARARLVERLSDALGPEQ